MKPANAAPPPNDVVPAPPDTPRHRSHQNARIMLGTAIAEGQKDRAPKLLVDVPSPAGFDAALPPRTFSAPGNAARPDTPSHHSTLEQHACLQARSPPRKERTCCGAHRCSEQRRLTHGVGHHTHSRSHRRRSGGKEGRRQRAAEGLDLISATPLLDCEKRNTRGTQESPALGAHSV